MHKYDLKDWSVENIRKGKMVPETLIVWKHNKYELRMYVSYTTYGYVNGEEVMEWYGRAKIGTNVTFGEYKHIRCDKIGTEEAREQIFEWATKWMKNFKLENYNIEDSLEEMDEYLNG